MQVLLGDAYDGQSVDMWSCGCSLYILLVGNYPFRSMADNAISHVKRMQAMFPRIMAGNYTPIPQVGARSMSWYRCNGSKLAELRFSRRRVDMKLASHLRPQSIPM